MATSLPVPLTATVPAAVVAVATNMLPLTETVPPMDSVPAPELPMTASPVTSIEVVAPVSVAVPSEPAWAPRVKAALVPVLPASRRAPSWMVSAPKPV